jgi:hypothetical protein
MEKRGQAAMEFLMTYGWAILAAVIAIGVLAWFGVFSPGRFMTETCVLSPPLACEDDSFANTSGVYLMIRNGAGEQINVTGLSATDCGANDALGEVVGVGETNTVDDVGVVCGTALDQGSRYRGTIMINYTMGEGTRIQQSSGNLIRRSVL